MVEKCSCSTQEPAIYIAERFFNHQDYIYYKSNYSWTATKMTLRSIILSSNIVYVQSQ